MNGSIDGQSGLGVIQGLWPRLQPDDRAALLRLATSAAGQQDAPATPRRRHRHYDDAELTALRAQLIAILAVSPTMPNRAIAERLKLPYSSFKMLKLNRFVRTALARSALPRSATLGYSGPRADEGESDGPG